jgi:hypothetical protein
MTGRMVLHTSYHYNFGASYSVMREANVKALESIYRFLNEGAHYFQQAHYFEAIIDSYFHRAEQK